jgi:plasmid stabilization system protein ParE
VVAAAHADLNSQTELARAQAEHRKQGTQTDLLHDNIKKSEQGTGRAYLLLRADAR